MTKRTILLAAFAAAAVSTPSAMASTPVTFSNATATFYQTYSETFPGQFSPMESINGLINATDSGFAIFQGSDSTNNINFNETLSQTALFTTSSAVASRGQKLTFTLYQNYFGPEHLLGDFSLGYATGPNPTLSSVDTPFTILDASSANGTTFTSQSKGQLLAGGPLPDTDVYTINVFENSASPITGIFLNVIDDPSNGLPTGGPGRQPINGNFVLTQFTASISSAAVPEPATWAMMFVGFAVVGFALRSPRSKIRALCV